MHTDLIGDPVELIDFRFAVLEIGIRIPKIDDLLRDVVVGAPGFFDRPAERLPAEFELAGAREAPCRCRTSTGSHDTEDLGPELRFGRLALAEELLPAPDHPPHGWLVHSPGAPFRLAEDRFGQAGDLRFESTNLRLTRQGSLDHILGSELIRDVGTIFSLVALIVGPCVCDLAFAEIHDRDLRFELLEIVLCRHHPLPGRAELVHEQPSLR